MFLIFARIQCGRGMRRYLSIFVSWLQIITRRRKVMTYRANLELNPAIGRCSMTDTVANRLGKQA